MKRNQLFLFITQSKAEPFFLYLPHTAVQMPEHQEVLKKLTAKALAWQKSPSPSKARKTVC